MQMADDFIESVVSSGCKLARHRKSSNLETRDLQLHLGKCGWVAVQRCDLEQSLSERSWNIKVPGFATEEPPPKKATATEAHKQVRQLMAQDTQVYSDWHTLGMWVYQCIFHSMWLLGLVERGGRGEEDGKERGGGRGVPMYISQHACGYWREGRREGEGRWEPEGEGLEQMKLDTN